MVPYSCGDAVRSERAVLRKFVSEEAVAM